MILIINNLSILVQAINLPVQIIHYNTVSDDCLKLTIIEEHILFNPYENMNDYTYIMAHLPWYWNRGNSQYDYGEGWINIEKDTENLQCYFDVFRTDEFKIVKLKQERFLEKRPENNIYSDSPWWTGQNCTSLEMIFSFPNTMGLEKAKIIYWKTPPDYDEIVGDRRELTWKWEGYLINDLYTVGGNYNVSFTYEFPYMEIITNPFILIFIGMIIETSLILFHKKFLKDKLKSLKFKQSKRKRANK